MCSPHKSHPGLLTVIEIGFNSETQSAAQLEQVHRRAARLIKGMESLSFKRGLKDRGLVSLALKNDMIGL